MTLGLTLAGGLQACGQEEGERCEVDSDCKNGMCVKATMGSAGTTARICASSTPTPTSDAATPDTSTAPQPDAPAADSAAEAPRPDMAPDLTPDAASADMAPTVDASRDGGG